MAENITNLPSGFILDTELPEGFVLDQKAKPLNPIEYWQATPEQREENFKALAQQKLDDRKEWEAKHPFVSRLQEEYQPNYLAEKKRLETQAKHGFYAPLPEIGSAAFAEVLPYANVARDTALATISRGKAGFLPTVAREAVIGATQTGTSDALNEIANNGLSINALKKFGQGVASGGIAGGALSAIAPAGKFLKQKITGLNPDIYDRLVNPNSKALDLTEEDAQNLILDTTLKVRSDFADLLQKKGDIVGGLLKKLPENIQFKATDIAKDVDNIVDNYSVSGNPAKNPVRRGGKNELNEINNLLYGEGKNILERENTTINPKELYDINQNISDNLIDWNKGKSKINSALEQIYGANADRISSLSPALREANKEYANLMEFQKGDAINQILKGDLLQEGKLGNAPATLKSYRGNAATANKTKNVTDLETLLYNEGYGTFTDKIDDANAALALAESIKTGVNPIGTRDIVKGLVKPELEFIRNLNRKLPSWNNYPTPLRRVIFNPLVQEAVAPMFGD